MSRPGNILIISNTKSGLNNLCDLCEYTQLNSVGLFFSFFFFCFVTEVTKMGSNRTRSGRAGLVMPVGRIHRSLRKGISICFSFFSI